MKEICEQVVDSGAVFFGAILLLWLAIRCDCRGSLIVDGRWIINGADLAGHWRRHERRYGACAMDHLVGRMNVEYTVCSLCARE